MEVEFILNDTKLKVNSNGELWKWITNQGNRILKNPKWVYLKGSIHTDKKDNYIRHNTQINRRTYITSRIIYYAFNQDWDINNANINNTIDHINRNSLDNNISNLRVATMKEQSNNRDCVINAKGYYKKSQKFISTKKYNGKHIYIGTFNTEEEAFNAYQNAKVERCIAPSNT